MDLQLIVEVVLILGIILPADCHPFHRTFNRDGYNQENRLIVLPPKRFPNVLSQSTFRHLDHDEYGRPVPVQPRDSDDYFNFSGDVRGLDPDLSVFSGYTRDSDKRANQQARHYLARGFRGQHLPVNLRGDRGHVFNRNPDDLYFQNGYFP